MQSLTLLIKMWFPEILRADVQQIIVEHNNFHHAHIESCEELDGYVELFQLASRESTVTKNKISVEAGYYVILMPHHMCEANIRWYWLSCNYHILLFIPLDGNICMVML